MLHLNANLAPIRQNLSLFLRRNSLCFPKAHPKKGQNLFKPRGNGEEERAAGAAVAAAGCHEKVAALSPTRHRKGD